MKFHFLGLAAILFATWSHGHELICAGMMRGAAPADSADHRNYAPERIIDILHIAIDVTPDFDGQSVSGTTRLRFKPLRNSLTEVKLHAVDLRISQVTATANVQSYQSTDSEIIVTFAEPLPRDAEQELTISYSAFPKKGLYFRTAKMGYRAEDEHLFTQGEDIEARHWFPCFDEPNEKFTSEITCRVPEAMTVLSNGRLVSEEVSSGIKVVRWLQDKPHVSYLISLVAGHFKKIEDQYKDIHLAFYTPASQIDLARNSFAETKEMMGFFEEEIGVPYPWHKYYQVCVQDFMWGGMENTSISTLTDRTLFPDETENIRSSQGLVAHELAHQWFGDLVTCEDWSQLWLNEGFATYYAHLYNLHKDGKEDFLYGLYNSANGFINRTVAEDSRPVVFRQYDAPLELFGYLVYPKGGWVLHMLRSELGADVFRKGVKNYLDRHQFDTVATHDLISALEEASGRSLDRFFDQWIFHPHHPELQVKYGWDAGQKRATVTVQQVQPLTNGVSLFHFPLKLRFEGAFGVVDRSVDIRDKQTELSFPLESAPEIFRVDPDYSLLAKVVVDIPRNMLVSQLKKEGDVIGQIMALKQLRKSRDKETVELIRERLQKDPFYGVRMEAADALRDIHTDEALNALIASGTQSDARVRQKVAIEVGGWFDERAAQFAHEILQEEKNPDIRHHAVRTLAPYPGEKNRDMLLAALRSDSHEEIVAQGAITALGARRDPATLNALIEELEREDDFSSRAISSALRTLANLARDTDDSGQKNRVYEFLLKNASSPKQTVRLGAIQALGTLRDERAIPMLETYANGAKEAPETTPAGRALDQIRSGRSTGNELQSLRTEVLDLKKQNDELKKSLEDLKKRVDANQAKPAPEETKPRPTRRSRTR